MENLKSEGKCFYCGKMYGKRAISRHLGTHLKQQPAVEKSSAYHLRIEKWHYFLNLLIDGDSTLEVLDYFLRAIWLECCGHMSKFAFQRWGDEWRMDEKICRLIEPGDKLWYGYDFGSTTELDVKVLGKLPFPVPEGIQLLSRNEPLEFWCDHCKKAPAVRICTAHWGDEGSWFCEACAEIHAEACDEAEYSMLNVANSPRTGVCAYEGGGIDLERDGVFVPQ